MTFGSLELAVVILIVAVGAEFGFDFTCTVGAVILCDKVHFHGNVDTKGAVLLIEFGGVICDKAHAADVPGSDQAFGEALNRTVHLCFRRFRGRASVSASVVVFGLNFAYGWGRGARIGVDLDADAIGKWAVFLFEFCSLSSQCR